MKKILFVFACTLPAMSFAAEYMNIECYIAEGSKVTKTFDGYVYGTVKNVGNKISVEGKNIATANVHRTGTPDTCLAPSHTIQDNDGYDYSIDDDNVLLYEFDYSQVELSCAQGSVIKRFGDLANFTKAMQAQAQRRTLAGNKPQCLDLSGLE